MFLECNNHEAHGPTDYHAYATISNRHMYKQFLWTYRITGYLCDPEIYAFWPKKAILNVCEFYLYVFN